MTSKRRRLITPGRLFSRRDAEALTATGNAWWWLAIVIVTTLIIVARSLVPTVDYEVYDVCQDDIYYEGPTYTYQSEVQREAAVERIRAEQTPIYKYDDGVMIADAELRISAKVAELAEIMSNTEVEDKTALYQTVLGESYEEELVNALNEVATQRLYQLETALNDLINQYYGAEGGVNKDDLQKTNNQVVSEIESRKYKESEQIILLYLMQVAELKANATLDEAATEAAMQARIGELGSFDVTVRSGQSVITRGEVINEEHLEMLSQTGLLESQKSIFYYLGVFGVVLILYLLLFIFCRKYYPSYAYDRKGILIIGALFTGYILICQVIMTATASSSGIMYSVFGYLMPLPAMAILFATLISHRFAYFGTALLAMFMALLSMSQINYVVVALISAFYTVRIVMRVRERFQLVRFGFYVGILNAVLIALMGFVGSQSLATIGLGMVVGLANGILSAFIAMGVIPIAERYFGMSTPMQLMELANPTNPLIRRLMTEAPGTYYHSVLVGNLAEAGADAIGADSLLVRVASYFHDIGKLVRPGYFSENQEPGTNPHAKLTPSLSALIIISHVKDGVEMAQEQGLPEDIVHIIQEHHGTSTVKYFYHQEAEALGEDAVDKKNFIYDGPKPQSKESALIMMADGVQAATQSTTNMTKEEMGAKIHEIIQGQFECGQFEECDLTFRDLHKVEEAFASVLSGLAHYRIAYPDGKTEDNVTLLADTLFDNNGQPRLIVEESDAIAVSKADDSLSAAPQEEANLIDEEGKESDESQEETVDHH